MRDYRLQVRLTPGELAVIRQNVVSSGYENVSQFVRDLAQKGGQPNVKNA
jgi:hypothetical protein